jgi:Pyridoxamine 5'-phosphate oxidase
MDDEEIPATAFVLDHRTCLVLLATERVGRLVAGQPCLTVIPVRYTLAGDRVTLTGIDGVVPPGQPGDRVVIEVDGVNEQRSLGWSVVVHGRLASASPGELDVIELELTGRWVSGSRGVPPLDDRGYL